MAIRRREQVRNEILLQCYGYRPGARDAERMATTCRREGELTDAQAGEFDREAAYLEDKGLVELARDGTARDHKRWTITAAGIDYLEEAGLV